MFRDTIRGLDKVFRSDEYENLIILVGGHSGTMKSTFSYQLMGEYLNKNAKNIGMYATLEQTKPSLVKNLTNIGIPLNDKLHIADYNRTREMYKHDGENADFLELTERLVKTTKHEHGDAFTVFCLDSLNALYTLMETDNEMDRRKRLYYFFKTLRDTGLTSFIITEIDKNVGAQGMSESFIADGVIELGVHEAIDDKKRYLEVHKMRHNDHSMRRFVMEVTNKGLAVLGPSVDDRKA